MFKFNGGLILNTNFEICSMFLFFDYVLALYICKLYQCNLSTCINPVIYRRILQDFVLMLKRLMSSYVILFPDKGFLCENSELMRKKCKNDI